MVTHWSLSDNKCPQVARTLLTILAYLNKAIVWMISPRPLISKSSNPRINSLVTVPKAPITIGLTVTFMFHNFFNSLARSKYLSFFSLSFSFLVVSRDCKVHNSESSLFFSFFFFFFFLCWLLLGLVVWPRLGNQFVFQNLRGVCASHFLKQILGCVYTIFFRMVKFQFFA